MAGNIKGITIEFRGETTKLDNALKKVNKETRTIDNELKRVNRSLKFNPRNVELLRQKEELLKQKITETKEKLDVLKRAQREMASDPSVDKNSAEYRELQREIIETESKLKHFEGEMKRFGSVGKQQIMGVANSMKAAGGKIKGIGRGITTSMSVWGLAGIYAGAKLIDSYEQQAEAELKLEKVYESNMGASKKAADATIEYASALQQVGVIGDEVTLAGAAVLAQYADTPETINKILPAMDNYLAKTKGLDATQEDAEAAAKLFGKALNGNYTTLERNGIVLSDNQKAMLENASMEERAAILADIVAEKTGNMNEQLANTDAGKIQQAKNAIGDMGEEIGGILLPAVADLVSWFQDNLLPKLQQFIDFMKEHPQIAQFALALAGIVAIAGPLLMFIGSLIGLVGSLAAVATALDMALLPVIGIVAAIVAAIAAAVAIGVLLYKNWDKIKAAAQVLWTIIKAKFEAIKNAIMKPIKTAVDFVKRMIDKIKSFFNFKVSLPKIKLPHFAITPKGWKLGDLLKGKIPHLSIKWYAEGGIFDSPTIAGIGEAGPEAVVPLDKLWNKLDAMAGGVDYTLLANAIVNALMSVDTSVVLNIDGKPLAEAQAPYMNTAINKLQTRQARQLGIVGV